MNCKRIYAISRELAPEYERVELASQKLGSCAVDQSEAFVAAWLAAVEAYNVKAESYLEELSGLTPNSVDTLRSAFAPRVSGDVWFEPEFLSKVAQYQSFNERLWSKYSGMQREPTFTVEELSAA